MKCPFCQQELESVLQLAGAGGLVEEAYLLCSKCNIRGERKLWQELIRTRKALDLAKDAIDVISLKYHKDTPSIFLIKYAQNAKAEITALTKGGGNE